ncbi:MAG: stress-responsive transcription factor hsf1 [Thelocarpon impressellum]|nr:MAG: stress-responsive transcription factor hsf1 [Thelocarpon impressellum]
MPPQLNPRKRPAPGTASGQPPSPTQQQHLPSTSPHLTNEQFLRWGQAPVDAVGNAPLDQAATNSPYGSIADEAAADSPQPSSLDGGLLLQQPTTSTQLTRRPGNQHLVARGFRQLGGIDDDPWADLGDGMELELRTEPDPEDDVESLVQRAQVARREALAKRKQIPPFVQKLSSFLDESRNTDLIRWSDKGDSFVVLDEDEFARTLIPELFKHNNYASFVRQLNMYGFHKRVGLSDNSMRASERKNKSPSEYFNQFFRRGRPELLWLINKPKNAKAPTAPAADEPRSPKAENGQQGGAGAGARPGPAAPKRAAAGALGSTGEPDGAGGTGGAVTSEQDMSEVRQQLRTIQQQQRVISGAINRLRKDQNQIYEQAVAFQALHDRHESSINAILTFLATVYNRSLEGHGGQDFANLFTNAIPSDGPGQRNVVDVGHVGAATLDQLSRYRRAPLLLGPPPAGTPDARLSTESPAASMASPLPTPLPRDGHPSPRMPLPADAAAEEPLDARSAGPASIKPEVNTPGTPQRDIMSMINSANANSTRGGQDGRLDFPAALNHYQTANGNAPLTPKQRSDMLNMMAQDTNAGGGGGGSNALTSPEPPSFPGMGRLDNATAELDRLSRLQAEQDANVQNLTNLIQPLSPTGSIPGLSEGMYEGVMDAPGAFDLDQIFNSGDYFGSATDGLGAAGGGGDPVGDGLFGVGLDGAADVDEAHVERDHSGRIVGTVNSSAGTSPGNAADEEVEDVGSPSKRRRKV